MKTQISRDSFRSGQRYSGVYQQQGRMLTDADWNELTELVKNRIDAAIKDAVGSGAPRDRGLRVLDQFQLQPGYLYVDGLLAQLPGTTAIPYADQPDFSEAQTLPLSGAGAPSSYTLYADVWERTVTALEDEQLLDAGLHGADTCTRTLTMLQVKWCAPGLDPMDAGVNPSKGNAPLTVAVWRHSSGVDPCDPCAAEVALDERIGNYLFRVEVHDVQLAADGSAQLTVKWSSENGAEQHPADHLPSGFAQAGWVYEFFDLVCEQNLGVHLARDFTPSRGQLMTSYPAVTPAGKPWVRRWDGFCVLNRSSSGAWSFGSGVDKGVALSTGLGGESHGFVQVGADFQANLNALSITLGLDGSRFVAGDFWLAAVREAAHAPGDLLLDEAAPQGIAHHYLVLAELDSAGVVTDCPSDAACRRMAFAPLSDLWAKNVGYDNQDCTASPAENVQQALDWLCQQRDLRFHNKHLHGWGIVCGLEVDCGPDTCESEDEETCGRRQVTIRKGHAIDCEGNDIVLKEARDEDLLAMIEAHDTAHSNDPILKEGDGQASLCIGLSPDGEPDCRVEKYDAKQDACASLLDGTLLKDFFDDCIQQLIDAVRDELTVDPEEHKTLVGPTTRRLISLVNLLIQLFNHDNGRYVFLSPKEHDILKKFYERLQQLMRSKTFCAMFEGDEFPDYPFSETKLSTIFGKGFHTRLRLTPDGKQAYTCGAANATIHVYDLTREEMVAVIDMPAGEGAQVVDVAFAPDGSALYAIAHLATGDTVFGVADIDASGKHAWRPVRVLCGVQLTVLQASKEANRLYAVGKGDGLFLFDPAILLKDTARPVPWYRFNASGHLSLDETSGQACAGANAANAAAAVTYTQVVNMALSATGSNLNPQETIPLVHPETGAQIVGTDALLAIFPKSGKKGRLCVVTKPWDASDPNKHLLVYALGGNADLLQRLLLPKTFVSLGWHAPSEGLLVGLEDRYCLQVINVVSGQVTTERHPAQISPVGLASTGKPNMVYVLNGLSNTISVIPGAELATDAEFLAKLADYRDSVIAAYWGLAGGVLQYLKDCFCHHLLVKCPACDADDKIYLAGIRIKENKIYNICNFSRRRYVKSFPTVEYWLSLVPLLPVFRKGVEKLCCLVLPDLFQKYYVTHLSKTTAGTAAYTHMGSKIESAQLRQGVRLYQGTSVKTLWKAEKKGLNLYSKLAGDAVINRVESASVIKPGIDRALVLDKPVSEARQRLESQGVVVASVQTYDRSQDNLKAYTGAPLRLNPGARISLYERDGKVMFYSLVEEKGAIAGVPPEVRVEIADLERRKQLLGDVSEITAELARTEARRAELMDLAAAREALGALDAQKTQTRQEVDGLKAELARLQSQRAELADVAAVSRDIGAARAQLESLRQARAAEQAALSEIEARRGESAAQLNTMRTDLETLRGQQREISLAIARERPVSDVAGIDAEMAKRLNTLGVRTVYDLARMDATRLAANRIDATAAKAMIDAANARLKL